MSTFQRDSCTDSMCNLADVVAPASRVFYFAHTSGYSRMDDDPAQTCSERKSVTTYRKF